MKKDKEKKLGLKYAELSNDLKNLIADIAGVAVSAIKDSTDLQKHLGIDSFNAVEILVAIEQRYGIKIEQAEVFGIRTFQDVFDLAKKYLLKK
ncbi:MAG: acyl carrier protein [Candidatus Omnitrophica bacterium]|nr:acyl carrier protein [Candidatus Omnitrophota bacterium]